MFVTAWMGILDMKTGVVTYANAGHNPPLVRHADGSFEYLRSRAGFVLAGMEGVRYRKQELQLEKGDTLYLYTDGVTEAANIENALFGEERLQNVLNENRDGSPEQLNDYIRVSNPGVWLVLAAVIVLLIGVCVWGIFGRLETTVGSAAVVKDGEMTLYVKEEYLGKITE